MDRVEQRRRTPQPLSSNATDVVECHRADAKEAIRSIFDDVFQVTDDCEKFGECDIENMKNDFLVAGRLNCEKKYKIFSVNWGL